MSSWFLFCSHLDHPLQAHTEVLLLVELEFLQRHASLSDELIMAKLILITHCESAERESMLIISLSITY